MLDVIIGISSLAVLVIMLKYLPTQLEPSIAYICALLLFIVCVCTGGVLASGVSVK
jgi:hypothetical protein